MSTETTVTMPSAIESRNDVFITDHGSIRVILSRARRPGRGAAPALAAFVSCRVVLRGFGGLWAFVLTRLGSGVTTGVGWVEGTGWAAGGAGTRAWGGGLEGMGAGRC
jgi:hypothetical protein